MSKILKNTTGSAISISDTGTTIPVSPATYTIPATDYLLWAASDNIVTEIGSGNVVVNDGSVDLGISDGTDLIKGIFPSQIEIVTGTNSLGSSENPIITNIPDNFDLPVTLRRSDINEIKEEFGQIKELLVMLTNNTVNIADGTGLGNLTKVNEFNALKVIDQRIPSSEDKTILIPIQEFFVDSTGSTDMKVNASAGFVDFTIKADSTVDKFIDSLSIRIADVNATADKFGNITSLTNGCQLIYSDLDNGEIIIGNALKTNFDFLRLCQGKPSFGNSNDALRIANASGNSEGYIPVLDFSEMFGLPWGVRLRAGSKEQLIIRIQDNTTGVDAFDAVAFGFKKVI